MLASLAQVFATYQMMFACLVPAIVLGAACERSRVLPAMVWVFCWTTLVYDPLAHWIWSSNGWAFKWGVYDCEPVVLAFDVNFRG
jgi:Amt family ammonium transporter